MPKQQSWGQTATTTMLNLSWAAPIHTHRHQPVVAFRSRSYFIRNRLRVGTYSVGCMGGMVLAVLASIIFQFVKARLWSIQYSTDSTHNNCKRICELGATQRIIPDVIIDGVHLGKRRQVTMGKWLRARMGSVWTALPANSVNSLNSANSSTFKSFIQCLYFNY